MAARALQSAQCQGLMPRRKHVGSGYVLVRSSKPSTSSLLSRISSTLPSGGRSLRNRRPHIHLTNVRQRVRYCVQILTTGTRRWVFKTLQRDNRAAGVITNTAAQTTDNSAIWARICAGERTYRTCLLARRMSSRGQTKLCAGR